MGRKRIILKAIQNANAQKVTLKQRMKGLLKKLLEFVTMCDADVCLIMFIDAALETWPQDLSKVQSIVEKYEREKYEKPPKMFRVEDFFDNRKNTVETEISKVKKDIVKIKYPTLNLNFNNFREEELWDFIAELDIKIEACNNRIQMLKNTPLNQSTQVMARESDAAIQLNGMQKQNMSSSQTQLVHVPMETPIHEDNNGEGHFNFANGVHADDGSMDITYLLGDGTDGSVDMNNLLKENEPDYVSWLNQQGPLLDFSSQPHDMVLQHNIPSQNQNEQKPPTLNKDGF